MTRDQKLALMARAIGAAYDGDADPIETPNNWARAITAAEGALAAIEITHEQDVERIARLLVEQAGGEPDSMVYVTPEGFVTGTPGNQDVRVVVWTRAVPRARQILEALELP